MARQQIAKSVSTGPYPAAGRVITMTAEDIANHSQIAITDKTVIVIQNQHASTTYTYTITSIADQHARTGDIAGVNIAAGAIVEIGPLGLDGWRQVDNNLYLQANNASVFFGAYELA